jgi:transcription-repair coupling factor (superfamily II helicase)
VPLDAIREGFARIPSWDELVAGAARGEPLVLAGLSGSARVLAPGALLLEAGRGALFVAASADAAEAVENDLAFLAGPERVASFPSLETLPYDDKSPHAMTVAARMATLARLRGAAARGEPTFVVTTVRALLSRLLPPEALDEAIVSIRPGDALDPRRLAEALAAIGFERLPVVEEPGVASVRGGIVDVFPHGRERPVRIEFAESGIESIREVDPRTQRSTGRLEGVAIPPQTEVPLTRSVRERAGASALPGLLGENVRRAAPFDGMECLLPQYFERVGTLLDYLPAGWAAVR